MSKIILPDSDFRDLLEELEPKVKVTVSDTVSKTSYEHLLTVQGKVLAYNEALERFIVSHTDTSELGPKDLEFWLALQQKHYPEDTDVSTD